MQAVMEISLVSVADKSCLAALQWVIVLTGCNEKNRLLMLNLVAIVIHVMFR